MNDDRLVRIENLHILTVSQYGDGDTEVLVFEQLRDDASFRCDIEAAAKEWLNTADAENLTDEPLVYWSNIIYRVSQEIWEKHGFRRIDYIDEYLIRNSYPLIDRQHRE